MTISSSTKESISPTRPISLADSKRRYNALNAFVSNSERMCLVGMMLLLSISSSVAFQVGSGTSRAHNRLLVETKNSHLNTRNTLRRSHHDRLINRLQSSKDNFDEQNFPPPLSDLDRDNNMSQDDDDDENNPMTPISPFAQFFTQQQNNGGLTKMPPIRVEDINVLLYDVFLIVNLSLSISFWVTHRLSFEYLASAFSEGSLFSILWIISGLYHGSFLMSAVDGHYGSTDERGGPKAAAALGLTTFINAVNLRLVLALLVAIFQHREVGMDAGEQLIPLEIAFGIALMSSWRALHSYFTPRI